MVRWHHWLDRYEFEQALRVGDGQGSLACCSPWGRKDLDMTERLNWSQIWLFFNPMDCSPPISVPGIFQARILEWGAISCSRWSYRPRDWTCASCAAGRILYSWVTRKPLELSRHLLNVITFSLCNFSCFFRSESHIFLWFRIIWGNSCLS